MLRLTDMPDTIPVFPLPGALLLPRARLPLNIFEPRYLAMLEDALGTPHRFIGMVQPREVPKGQNGGPLQKIGCAGRVTAFSETEDGRYLITLSGVSRFRVSDVKNGFKPYLNASVTWDSFEGDMRKPQPDEDFDRPEFLSLLGRYFEAAQLQSDWDSLREA
ncbi:MAG: LON peptidase substrate-binding domain-containing protein, partial [Pseudomonadota bacterium]